MKFCCRATPEIANTVIAIHIAFGGTVQIQPFPGRNSWAGSQSITHRVALIFACRCFGNVGLSKYICMRKAWVLLGNHNSGSNAPHVFL